MEFLLIGIVLAVTSLMAAAALRLSSQLHQIMRILMQNDKILASRDDDLKVAIIANTEAIKTIARATDVEGLELPVFMEIDSQIIDFFVGPTGEIEGKDRMN